jgi:glutamate/tyrosine decarboxylase-like PLP-dependent enzyme
MPDYRDALDRAVRHASSYLENINRRPVGAAASHDSLLKSLRRPLADEGASPKQIIDELAYASDPGIVASGGGRFFAWVIGGALPSAVAADWLVAAWDQNAALYACGPAAAVVEEVAGEWLKDILGLPAHASFAFTGGCQMAHITCLIAARHALLERAGWDVAEKGTAGGPSIKIFSSSQSHASFDRAARLLGFGRANLVRLESDQDGRLKPEALEEALAANTSPTFVLLQAGEINTGIFDDFAALIPIAHRHGAWVHVDGAFGLWAAASPRFRYLTAGVEQADSWATDGHKWLQVPYDSGFAFIAHPDPHRAAISHRASYLTHEAGARDEMDWNLEWSRRARGFATYAAIRELGRGGIAELVDRCCRHARTLTAGIGQLDGAEMLWMPVINQGLVRFLDPNGSDHDRRTDEVIAKVNASGEAFFGPTLWRGMRAMRISVSSWQTSDEDVQRTIEAVRKALRS